MNSECICAGPHPRPDCPEHGYDPAHDVKFHIGTGVVVCTCGAHFESERYATRLPKSAVALWAEHIRRGAS